MLQQIAGKYLVRLGAVATTNVPISGIVPVRLKRGNRQMRRLCSTGADRSKPRDSPQTVHDDLVSAPQLLPQRSCAEIVESGRSFRV